MQMQQQIIEFSNSNPNFVNSIFIIGITLLVYYFKKFISQKIIKRFIKNTSAKFDDEMFPLLDRLISIVIFCFGISYFLINLGINLNAILTTIGASSIILAYSCKDTLSNLMAGLIILADRPFKVGDYIELPSKEYANVVYIGLRRSKFLFFSLKENEYCIITVPNSDLAKSKIVNYTQGKEFVEKKEHKNG